MRTDKVLYGIMLFALILSAFGGGSVSSVSAQQDSITRPADNILSDGQFVSGPNVGDFNLKSYIAKNAPYLLKYADDLYERSEYFSINPKVYITLLEVNAHLISSPDPLKVENPFGLSEMDFISQIDYVSNAMVSAYYLHINSYSSLPASQRVLAPFVTQSSEQIIVPSNINAGTYAMIAGLASIRSEKEILQILEKNQVDGFYQTYLKLFMDDDPLSDGNHIYLPGQGVNTSAPDNFLQLPFLRGLSWKFGGVHDNSGGGGPGSPFNDASAMDFYPVGSVWGMDTSSMWVVASAPGTPIKISNCYFKILHGDGWETTYYHLENIQPVSAAINQNDKIGVIANTLAEATCSGGAASGPHVHFTLKRNGALVAINGTPLSGWYVHTGRWNYDTDPNYAWIERAGQKKYPFNSVVLSEGTVPAPSVVSSARADANFTGASTVNFTVTFTQSVTGVDISDFSPVPMGVLGAAVSGVSGSGSVYTVTVNTGSGSGSIRLNVLDDDSIINEFSSPLGGAGAGNGVFVSGETYTINKTWIFGDVPNTYWANGAIETIYNDGISGGCTLLPLNYCPANSVTRAQMAIFLLRGMHGSAYTPPAATGTMFTDVSAGSFAAAWIEQLANEGITSGCGGGNFCPNSVVTRAQMAIFLVRAKHGIAFVPPTATGIFSDVPVGSFGANYIEQLVTDGVTSGCGGGLYCPSSTVKRDSMAVFLVKNFNLP